MLIASTVAAAAAVFSAGFAWWNRRKVAEIHVMVNSTLQAALERVEELEKEIR